MNPEDMLQLEIWWVMQQLRKESLLSGRPTFSLNKKEMFDTGKINDHVPSNQTQKKILFKLDGLRVINIEDMDTNYSNLGIVFPIEMPVFDRRKDEESEIKFRITILQPKFDEYYKECEIREGKDKKNEVLPQQISKADVKKLYILERLKDEWDLAPKKINGKKISVSEQTHTVWQRKCDINYNQLGNILGTFEEESLIRYQFYNIGM